VVKSGNTNRIYSRNKPLVNRYGVQFPNQKLTPEQRLEIYQRWCGGEGYQTLADEYGVSVSRARSIICELKKVVEWE
jgi:hypothetical protein